MVLRSVSLTGVSDDKLDELRQLRRAQKRKEVAGIRYGILLLLYEILNVVDLPYYGLPIY